MKWQLSPRFFIVSSQRTSTTQHPGAAWWIPDTDIAKGEECAKARCGPGARDSGNLYHVGENEDKIPEASCLGSERPRTPEPHTRSPDADARERESRSRDWVGPILQRLI